MNIRENAKKYFEEELSGEPLYQDSVIDWLVEFAEQQIMIDRNIEDRNICHKTKISGV